MKKKPALKKILLLLILPVFGLVVFSYSEIGLFAKTESQELEQLFKDMGVLQIPPGNNPIEIRLIFGRPGVWPALLKCRRWRNCIRSLKIKIL
jgi:hypothetical protein